MHAGDEKVNMQQMVELANSISESTVLGHIYPVHEVLLSQPFKETLIPHLQTDGLSDLLACPRRKRQYAQP